MTQSKATFLLFLTIPATKNQAFKISLPAMADRNIPGTEHAFLVVPMGDAKALPEIIY